MIPGSVNSLLLGAEAAGGYNISRSLRFNAPDSAYLSRTPASAGNRKTWTWAGWVKRSAIAFSAEQHIWGVTGTTDATYGEMLFGTGDTLRFAVGYNTAYGITTTRVFRDPSAWYHIVLAFDATQSTAASKIRLYVNGVEETAFSSDNRSSLSNQDWGYNNNVAHYIGRQANSDIRHFNGYLADIHFIDGQALDPTSFGEFSATTGVWVPKAYSGGSYGTNGFRLDFSNNASTTTIGEDAAGSNDWTANNISVTAGVGNDSLVDSPTNYGTDTGAGGEVRGNYCTWNPLDNSNTISNGCLDISPAFDGGWTRGTFWLSTGKWYWEHTVQTASSGHHVGVNAGRPGDDSYRLIWRSDGLFVKNSSTLSSIASYTTGDVLGFAYDADTLEIKLYKNNTLQSTQTLTTPPSGRAYAPHYLGGNSTGLINSNFGQRSWVYQSPSGFKALCTANLPAPVVTKPSDLMDVVTWTGNSASSRAITGLGFSPDFVWIKDRTNAYNHVLFDAVRGAGGSKVLFSNRTTAEGGGTGEEGTNYGALTSFDSTGFTVSPGAVSSIWVNQSSDAYVAWAWDAGTSTVTNTQGSITSQVRANASAGFSIVSWTGNATNGATVGHGLGVKPHLVIYKNRTDVDNWPVLSDVLLGSDGYLYLNSTAAKATAPQIAAPTSSVLTLPSYNDANGNGDAMIAYCFAPVAGYSAFGSYTGNGSSTDNTFVYTGMRPRFVLLKRSDSTGNWVIWDAARNTYNVANSILLPNSSAAEYSPDSKIDILSNGFKIRDNSSDSGTNGGTYIYAAFAESPFVANNRAR